MNVSEFLLGIAEVFEQTMRHKVEVSEVIFLQFMFVLLKKSYITVRRAKLSLVDLQNAFAFPVQDWQRVLEDKENLSAGREIIENSYVKYLYEFKKYYRFVKSHQDEFADHINDNPESFNDDFCDFVVSSVLKALWKQLELIRKKIANKQALNQQDEEILLFAYDLLTVYTAKSSLAWNPRRAQNFKRFKQYKKDQADYPKECLLRRIKAAYQYLQLL